MPKFPKTFSWKFPLHVIFIAELPVKMFTFQKFNNFQSFWNLFLKFRNFFGGMESAPKRREMSQNKRFNESYNGSARVINLCAFPSQPMQNKQLHHGALFLLNAFFTNLAVASIYRHTSRKLLKCFFIECTSPSSLHEMSNSL